MQSKKKPRKSGYSCTNNAAEIIIDSSGRLLVVNLTGDLLEALRPLADGDPSLEARYRQARKYRRGKK